LASARRDLKPVTFGTPIERPARRAEMHTALPGAARALAPAAARAGAPAALGRRAASARTPCAARHARRAPHAPRAGRPGRGGDGDYAAGGGASEPLDFLEDEYHRVGLHVVQATVDPPSGFLLFLREGDAPAEADDGAPGARNREGIPKDLPKEGLAVSIGGDTFQALGLLLRREESPRPREFSCTLGRPAEAENTLETDQPTNRSLTTDRCPK
jgi:hypothetical protein